MTYSATDVAKYIITYCYNQDHPVSNLKLQKVLYYTWIDYYKTTGNELFCDDICAWPLGPVIPTVYYEFCSYAGTPILCNYKANLSEPDCTIINGIVDRYLRVSASVLVDRTHKKGTPWDIIFNNGTGNREVIPFPLIKEKEC